MPFNTSESEIRPRVHLVMKLDAAPSCTKHASIVDIINERADVVSFSEIDSNTTIIAIGGDGTVIHAAKCAAVHDVAVAGINKGRLGFLPDFEPTHSDVNRLLDAIAEMQFGSGEVELKDKYNITTESRSLLEYQTDHDGDSYALNEFYITNKTNQVLKGEVYINGAIAFPFIGDGLIVGTATGSTAYSLSAGGAIIDPSLNVIQITPVAPHMLGTRPVIVGSDNITIKIDESTESTIFCDGQDVEHQTSPRTYEFRLTGLSARVIRNHKKHVNIFNVLKDKLFFNSRND